MTKELCNLQVKCDELWSFLYQSSGHIRHTSWHGCLADAYSSAHRCLERAWCVESQSSQHLHLRADGSRSLCASTESLKHRKLSWCSHVFAPVEKKGWIKLKLTSCSSSIRYRMNCLGKPNCESRKLSDTDSKSKRSKVLWPRPCRSRSQSRIAIGIAILWLNLH